MNTAHDLTLERTLARPFDIAELWENLIEARWRARETFSTETHLYTVVEKAPKLYRAPTASAMNRVERVLLGDQVKLVALESGKSDSSISYCVAKQLRRMQIVGRVSTVPLIYSIAVHAARRLEKGSVQATISVFDEGTWLVSTERPRLTDPRLTASELRTLLVYLDGNDYANTAAKLGRSRRTVANQISSVFKKLGVSGHGKALALLLSEAYVAKPL